MADDDDDDDGWKAFLAHRDGLQKQGADQLANFDKTLLLLATGALSLSIVFFEKIGGSEPTSQELMATSWAFFAFSILLNLFSYVTSWLDTVREIRFMDQNVNTDWRAQHENFPRSATISLNFFSGLLFVIGVILLLRFAFINMS
jgi:hypothetical protein